MLRIGSMNMLLHGVENPDIRYRDSLAQDHAGEEEKYTLVLANPPFAGSLDYESCAKDLLQVVKTKTTELLFLVLFLRLLKPGGRAAIIVPDGVLFGSASQGKTYCRRIQRLMKNAASARRLVRQRASERCEYCDLAQSSFPLVSFHVEHVGAKQHGGSDDLDWKAHSTVQSPNGFMVRPLRSDRWTNSGNNGDWRRDRKSAEHE